MGTNFHYSKSGVASLALVDEGGVGVAGGFGYGGGGFSVACYFAGMVGV